MSFAPNPDFKQVFPAQVEILQYISRVAEKYNVRQHFTGKTECRGASWKEDTRTWIVKLESLETGNTFIQECRILIMAVGGVVDPKKLDIPGAESFRGEIIHTARWKHDVELKGKDVVVIGNGGKREENRVLCQSSRTDRITIASAVQLIPEIIGKPRFITQFARVGLPVSRCELELPFWVSHLTEFFRPLTILFPGKTMAYPLSGERFSMHFPLYYIL